MIKPKADTPDAFFAALEGAPAALSHAARQAVRSAAPELEESLYHGFPSYKGARWALSIVPHSAHVNLQFAEGASLDSPRLEGTGKALRHVKIRDAGDLDDGLAALIRSAAERARA
jgi:hypothetical protein